MTNMRPYSDVSSYLRGLYLALDERDRLVAAGRRSSSDYDQCNHKIANLAGTLAIGDPRLLSDEVEFLRHLLHVEGFAFDGVAICVPDPVTVEPWPLTAAGIAEDLPF